MNVAKLPQNWNQLSDLALIGPMDFTLNSPLSSETGLIFVDGGTRHLHRFANHPYKYSLGDGDSAPSGLKFDQLFDPVKDETDLELALQTLPKHSFALSLWGFLGGRRDHELAAYGAVAHFLLDRPEHNVVHFDEVNKILAPGSHQLEFSGGFSLLAFYPTTLHLDGNIDYKSEDVIELRPFSGRGISNKAYGPFELTCNSPLLLWRGDA
ncbi:MAG: hypothetical protein Fur0010_22230 [Bdellovibrio sp.]